MKNLHCLCILQVILDKVLQYGIQICSVHLHLTISNLKNTVPSSKYSSLSALIIFALGCILELSWNTFAKKEIKSPSFK